MQGLSSRSSREPRAQPARAKHASGCSGFPHACGSASVGRSSDPSPLLLSILQRRFHHKLYRIALRQLLSVGWGPFSLGGQSVSSEHTDYHQAQITGSTITFADPQIIGFFVEVLPLSPNPSPTLQFPSGSCTPAPSHIGAMALNTNALATGVANLNLNTTFVDVSKRVLERAVVAAGRSNLARWELWESFAERVYGGDAIGKSLYARLTDSSRPAYRRESPSHQPRLPRSGPH
jgi:hypothetical protein